MTVEEALKGWGDSLLKELPLGGLWARNQTTHKWKAPYRSMVLRETILWRTHDLLTQSLALHQQRHTLGARILLRGAFESLAMLIYLNQNMLEVLSGILNFHDFCTKTTKLLLGSKDKSTPHESINIVTILGKCEKKYPGIMKLYSTLSESAHPSYEGICRGYSKIDYENYVTTFSNLWHELHGEKHLQRMELCIEVSEHEYNVWGDLFTQLEAWIEANDEQLEATKPATTD